MNQSQISGYRTTKMISNSGNLDRQRDNSVLANNQTVKNFQKSQDDDKLQIFSDP